MNSDILTNFGKRVRQLRVKLGLSQEEFAERANLHRTYIGSIERGEQNISLLNIAKIAKALDVQIIELFIEE